MSFEFFEDTNKIEKEIERRKDHFLWVEKYRPVSLDTFIGNESLKDKIQGYINSNDVAHLLLYGPPGTGKTTTAKIIVNSIQCDSLYMNASDENSVDDIRTKVKSFASTVGFTDLKIIILDECDYASLNFQAALRNVMETFSGHTRFILTCNHIEKMHPAIISRCQTFEVVPPSKKDIAKHVATILKSEKVQFEVPDMAFVVNSFYPDIRRILNSLQQGVKDGKLVLDKKSVIESDFKLKILEILKDKNQDKKQSFNNIRQLLADNKVIDFTDTYRILYDSIDDYASDCKAEAILAIADGNYKEALSVDHEINFCATMINLLVLVKKK
jgi:DNA polymerase III delta prime subunit